MSETDGLNRRQQPGHDTESIVAAYLSGSSLRELARMLGMSRSTVARRLAAAVIDQRPSTSALLPADPQWWQTQLDAGRSVAQLADELNTTSMTVYRHLTRLGLRRSAPKPFQQWLAERTVAEGDCLRWTRARHVDGYPITYRDGGETTATRVIWEHHHGPIPAGAEVTHADGCLHRDCVHLHHLHLQNCVERGQRWAARAAYQRGEDHWNAKLSEADARDILASTEPAEVLAARFDVRRHTITSIRTGVRWRWLSGSPELPDKRPEQHR